MKQTLVIPPSSKITTVEIDTSYTVTETDPPVENKEPIAEAGSNIELTEPTEDIFLDGTKSYDPDGTIKSFLWEQIDGPKAVIVDPAKALTEIIPAVGVSLFRLTIEDDKGKKDSDETVVKINPPVVVPPAAKFMMNVKLIPFSDPDMSPHQGRGAEWWNKEYKFPEAGQSGDAYVRYKWNHFETAQGQYDFTRFDRDVQEAISQGRKFGFGIMSLFPGNKNDGSLLVDGGYTVYPVYLHQLMQSESVKDWKTNGASTNTGPTTGTGYWVPNYNSQHYLKRLFALYFAINAHIYQKGWQGIINYVDVRGYGSTGEWHHAYAVSNMNQFPSGTRATVATLKSIIDVHVEAFPNFPLVAIVNTFDANRFQNTMNPPEIAAYALTVKNNWGPLGWRRDSWGNNESYYSAITDGNNITVSGVNLANAIMNRYKTSPIVGEPCCAAGTGYQYLPAQVVKYHVSTFGNSNYDGGAVAANVVLASKSAGYRIAVTKGEINIGTHLSVSMELTNTGVAPTYDDWMIMYTLKDANGNVTRLTSAFNPKFLLGTKLVEDVFTMPALPKGSYQFGVEVADPSGYRSNMALAGTVSAQIIIP